VSLRPKQGSLFPGLLSNAGVTCFSEHSIRKRHALRPVSWRRMAIRSSDCQVRSSPSPAVYPNSRHDAPNRSGSDGRLARNWRVRNRQPSHFIRKTPAVPSPHSYLFNTTPASGLLIIWDASPHGWLPLQDDHLHRSHPPEGGCSRS
jgi:hypothetical protein